VELEKELEEKRQVKIKKESLLQQIREEKKKKLKKNTSKPWQRNS